MSRLLGSLPWLFACSLPLLMLLLLLLFDGLFLLFVGVC